MNGGGEIVSQHQSRAKMYREFFKQVSGSFKHVIQIAGNHEYYHHNWENTIPTLKTEASKHSNFHFLEKDTITIENITFIGTTLWTNCNSRDPLTIHDLTQRMNDYNVVRMSSSNYRKLTPFDTIKEHDKCLNFIKEVIDRDLQKQYVVCTHHAPSTKNIHPKYINDPYMNGGYASDLSEFILNYPQIKLWTHGHTHTPFDYIIGQTQIVCNPRGYADFEEIADNFIPKVIEIR